MARLGGLAGLPLEPGDPEEAAAPTFAEATASPQQVVVHVHPQIVLPQQAAPVVQINNQLPEQPAPQINNLVQVQPAPVNASIEVHPAAVTVIDNHPTRAEQVVERDENDEITKTITTYSREIKAP